MAVTYEELTQDERIVVDDTLAHALDRGRAWAVPLTVGSPEIDATRATLVAWVVASRK